MSLRERLIGTWDLVSYTATNVKDSSDVVYPMGEDVKGIIMYSIDGYMSAQLQTPGQALFTSKELKSGTEAECNEAFKRYVAYTGPFFLDEEKEEPVLLHHMSLCSFPNYVGDSQRRWVKIEGDKLILSVSGANVLGVTRNILVLWQRMAVNTAKNPDFEIKNSLPSA